MDWIGLAQYRNRWRALVNEVMDSRVLTRGISSPTSGHVSYSGRTLLPGVR
jgi:hypothetical protein